MKTTKQTLQELLDEVEGERLDEELSGFGYSPEELQIKNQTLDTITTIIKRKIENL